MAQKKKNEELDKITEEATTQAGEEDDEEEDSGPEDNEATVIAKKMTEDILRASQQSFMKQGEKPPVINRRIGVGLAAIVKQKMEAKRKMAELAQDDDSSSDV